MVQAKTLLIVLAVGAFFLAGGASLIRPAFATAQQDISDIKTGLSEQVKNIQNTLSRNGVET